ncbi:DUF397 domain-containing protein [Actinomadura madurae]|uniref:DUF397 domain-containing protein n=1 Tax=Actinomadura madurae TaxID=1993 RepID=UPI0020265384|nr:DUF397 domain-containing protein [Actinomadura madurae]MCP9955071.1 DUF397 domain-containing protein [Actinomadura madurae]MCP9971804.1 DUF397 domain-containing protein [Actinomadura madurae]MCP9984311.1 DUF397 domain-containing protein [Actinomadura madurae]MCQ0004139.1 DUF397 domain-containing protein [Actinomadura madurae]MCQ0020508.1 DUF397 domain-containing protein [Actinomadura madurae]
MKATDLPPTRWRKSSYSGSQAGECVELASIWRKSTYSSSNLEECVEVAPADRAVVVRDSKDPEGPVLTFGARAWSAFLNTLKARG